MNQCPYHEGLQSDITEIKDDVKAIRNRIFGNGKDGLDVEIDRNTQFRIEMQNSRSVWNKVLPSVIGGVLVGIIMFVIQILTSNSLG